MSITHLTCNSPNSSKTNSDYLSELILNFVNTGNDDRITFATEYESESAISQIQQPILDAPVGQRLFRNCTVNSLEECYTFDKICRCCLSNDAELKEIFNGDFQFQEMLQSVTSVKFTADDGYPGRICVNCILQLNKCVTFKHQVESADVLLRQYVGNDCQECQEPHLCLAKTSTNLEKCLYNDHCPTNQEEFLTETPFREDFADKLVDECDNDLGEAASPTPSQYHSSSSDIPGEIMHHAKEVETEKNLLILVEDDLECTERKSKITITSTVLNDEIYEALETSSLSKLQVGSVTNGPKKKKKAVAELQSTDVCSTPYVNRCSLGNTKPQTLLYSFNKDKKSFRCSICPKRFTNESILQDHINCHRKLQKEADRKPVKSPAEEHTCKECDEVFAVEQDFRVHNSLHTIATREQTSFKCHGCNKDFGNLKRLKRHIPTHFVEKPYKCHKCDRGFSEMASLTRHYRRHTNNKRERKHTCSECDKKYSDAYALKIHMRTHTGEKPWECEDCGKGFTDCRLLNSHRKLHGTTKMYACEECGNRFTHYSNLRTHIRTHTGEKPYACNKCPKSFTQSSNLVLHMRTHTGERPYKCTACPKAFASSSTLTGHLRWHSYSVMRQQEKATLKHIPIAI